MGTFSDESLTGDHVGSKSTFGRRGSPSAHGQRTPSQRLPRSPAPELGRARCALVLLSRQNAKSPDHMVRAYARPERHEQMRRVLNFTSPLFVPASRNFGALDHIAAQETDNQMRLSDKLHAFCPRPAEGAGPVPKRDDACHSALSFHHRHNHRGGPALRSTISRSGRRRDEKGDLRGNSGALADFGSIGHIWDVLLNAVGKPCLLRVARQNAPTCTCDSKGWHLAILRDE